MIVLTSGVGEHGLVEYAKLKQLSFQRCSRVRLSPGQEHWNKKSKSMKTEAGPKSVKAATKGMPRKPSAITVGIPSQCRRQADGSIIA